MVSKFFRDMVDLSPKFSLKLWQGFYNVLAWRSKNITDWRYMNYGYADAETATPDDINSFSKNLYHHLFKKIDLAGKDILEVGCGRGGGCELLLSYNPKTVTGIDFSKQAIKFCNKTYKTSPLTFVTGNAEALPFADESFDIVVNLESSHCYGNRPAFFKEVTRTLRPGGYFLYADFMGRVHYHKREPQLQASGLQVLDAADITSNILRSMQLNNALKQEITKKHIIKPLRKAVGDFSGVVGSDIYNNFEQQKTIYYSMLCCKQPSGQILQQE